MSVRVNLLPPEIVERERQRRIASVTILLVGLFVLLLLGVYLLKLADVNAARSDRDAAQQEVTRLEARLAELEEFRVLAQRLDSRNALLTTAMEREISWARVLNDLSLAFPADSSLVTLNAATVEPLVEGAAPAVGEADLSDPVASVAFTGYSVERYAPGVESVLVDFAEARGFDNSYLQTAATALRGTTEVTDFTGSVDLNDEVFTDRYADGLPAEVAE